MAMQRNAGVVKQDIGNQGAGNDKVIAALAYLGVLAVVPFLMEKKSGFVRYHMGQGLTLFVLEIAYGIAYRLLAAVVLTVSWRLYFIVRIAGCAALVFPVLAVTGIINVVNGQEKELPMIGRVRWIR